MQAAPTGEPRKQPASKSSWQSAATIVPSLFAPSFTRIFEPEVGPVPRKTSSRVIVILTGRPALRESTSAAGSRYTGILPPKPPPISEGVTLIVAGSLPVRVAVSFLTPKGPWVAHQISAVPSSRAFTRHAWGSM